MLIDQWKGGKQIMECTLQYNNISGNELQENLQDKHFDNIIALEHLHPVRILL